MLTYTDIFREFAESLGYIRQDIRWLCDHNSGLNYTVALLAACGCEALANGGAYASKEQALAEILPDADWQRFAKPLFDALRNGLAHGFDTKHIHAGDRIIQIVMVWGPTPLLRIGRFDNEMDGLFVGIIPLGRGICELIDRFEARLQGEPPACERFRRAMQRDRRVDGSRELWEVLKQKG